MRMAVLGVTLLIAAPSALHAQVTTLPGVTVEAERVRGAKMRIFEQRRAMACYVDGVGRWG